MDFSINIDEIIGQFSKMVTLDQGNDYDLEKILDIFKELENDTSLTTFKIIINENILKFFIDYFIKNKYKFYNYEKGYYLYYKRVDPYDSLSDDDNFDPDYCPFSNNQIDSIKNIMNKFK